jgi:hypothetical protein
VIIAEGRGSLLRAGARRGEGGQSLAQGLSGRHAAGSSSGMALVSAAPRNAGDAVTDADRGRSGVPRCGRPRGGHARDGARQVHASALSNLISTCRSSPLDRKRQLGNAPLHRAFVAGSVVILRKEPGRGLFVLLAGEVDVSRSTAGEGARHAQAGRCVGEMSMLNDSPRATAGAPPGTVLFLPSRGVPAPRRGVPRIKGYRPSRTTASWTRLLLEAGHDGRSRTSTWSGVRSAVGRITENFGARAGVCRRRPRPRPTPKAWFPGPALRTSLGGRPARSASRRALPRSARAREDLRARSAAWAGNGAQLLGTLTLMVLGWGLAEAGMRHGETMDAFLRRGSTGAARPSTNPQPRRSHRHRAHRSTAVHARLIPAGLLSRRRTMPRGVAGPPMRFASCATR